MFSIIDIIGKNPLSVEKILGRADDSEFVKLKDSVAYIKTYYRKGGIEIIYIDNIADWVIVDGKEKKLIAEIIHFLGVRFTPATIKDSGATKYYRIAGLAEVAFYGDKEGNIESIHIKAFTILI